MPNDRRTLELVERHGRLRYCLEDRVISGGAPIDLCFSGGWVTGRFEWSGDAYERPCFHYSLELLAEGKVETGTITIPEGAVVRWPLYQLTGELEAT